MSRDISWIKEIKNNTNDDYVIWCWDTDNEGVFKDWRTNKEVGKNDGGKQVTIKAGAHLSVGGCGIPDGGDKNGRPKSRVICKKSIATHSTGDPERGLRMNRVMANGDYDKIVFRNAHTTAPIGEIRFHRGLEQNLILRIDNDGIFFSALEAKESTEWKAFVVGRELGKFVGELGKELAKDLLKAATTAAMAA